MRRTSLIGVLAWWGIALGAHPNPGASARYENERFGYSLSYPTHWRPSGLPYANAFEIRNYDVPRPESVPERNRASVIVVDTLNDTPRATERFIAELIARTPNGERHEFEVAGRRAVRVQKQIPGQQLAPGTLQTQGEQPKPSFYHSIVTTVGNGRHLLSIDGTAPADADPDVVRDILLIESSLLFTNPVAPP